MVSQSLSTGFRVTTRATRVRSVNPTGGSMPSLCGAIIVVENFNFLAIQFRPQKQIAALPTKSSFDQAHVCVNGVENVIHRGLRFFTIKPKGNTQIRFLRNARAVIHRGCQTFFVDRIATQGNVDMQKGGFQSAVLCGNKIKLVRVRWNSKHWLHVIVKQPLGEYGVFFEAP